MLFWAAIAIEGIIYQKHYQLCRNMWKCNTKYECRTVTYPWGLRNNFLYRMLNFHRLVYRFLCDLKDVLYILYKTSFRSHIDPKWGFRCFRFSRCSHAPIAAISKQSASELFVSHTRSELIGAERNTGKQSFYRNKIKKLISFLKFNYHNGKDFIQQSIYNTRLGYFYVANV